MLKITRLLDMYKKTKIIEKKSYTFHFIGQKTRTKLNVIEAQTVS